jgi:hypothetical protein
MPLPLARQGFLRGAQDKLVRASAFCGASVTIAMRIDNDGEGGVLALMARLADERSLQCSESLTCEQFCSVFNGEQA